MATTLAECIVENLVAASVVEEVDRELYVYGFFLLVTCLFFFLVTVAVGFFLGIPCESAVFFVAFITLRTYAGGIHAKTEAACTVLTTIALGATVITIKILENTNVGILPLFVFSNLCILLLSPLDSHEKPLDEEDRRKYRRISYSLLIVCDAITIAAAILTVPALYYPITCGMFLEAVLLSVGKICNHSKYGSA